MTEKGSSSGLATPGEPAVERLQRSFRQTLVTVVGRFPAVATRNDLYLALAHTVRDCLIHRWMRTGEHYYRNKVRSVCYLSAEFLLGAHLGNLSFAGIEIDAQRWPRTARYYGALLARPSFKTAMA